MSIIVGGRWPHTGPDHECAGLHGEETVHDEHLEEAGREASWLTWGQTKNGQDLGDDSEAEHHVQQGEEAEQVVHGLVQRRLQPNGDQEGAVGPHEFQSYTCMKFPTVKNMGPFVFKYMGLLKL